MAVRVRLLEFLRHAAPHVLRFYLNAEDIPVLSLPLGADPAAAGRHGVFSGGTLERAGSPLEASRGVVFIVEISRED